MSTSGVVDHSCPRHGPKENAYQSEEEKIYEARRRRSALCSHKSRCWINAVRGFGTNFVIGVSLKVIVSLLRNFLRRKLPTVYIGRNLSEFLSLEPIRFGLFMGTFASGYKSINCFLRFLLEENNKLNAFIAGCLAGQAILWVDKEDRWPISVYLFVRAAKITFDAATSRDWFPASFKNIPHGDTMLMMISACQILYCYIIEQASLPVNYLKFLLGAGGKDQSVIGSLAKVTHGQPIDMGVARSYCVAKNIDPSLLLKTQGQSLPLCNLMHPEQGCFLHWIEFFKNHMLNYSLRFYVPLNLMSVILFQRARLRNAPFSTVQHVLKSCTRSAAFLSLYCANAWGVQCLLRKYNLLNGKTLWAFVGAGAGLATLLENKQRRLELALYCASPALQSFYFTLLNWKYINKMPHVEAAMFSCAMGIIMMAHQNKGDRLTPTLGKIMKGLMGID